MIVIHDKRIPNEYIERLKEVIPNSSFCGLGKKEDSYFLNVYDSIRMHPDIYFFQIDGKKAIYAKDIPGSCLNVLKKNGVDLIPGEKAPRGSYPDTAIYNAVRIGEFVVHNMNITDPSILRFLEAKSLKTIHVNQGYSRCSIVPVGKRAAVTQDGGIAKSLQKAGLEVLVISAGEVILPGERRGFLGGASGVLSDGRIIFLGDVRKHPDFGKIDEFLKKNGTKYVSLKGLPLYDSGSFMIFDV